MGKDKIKRTSQYIDNESFDETYEQAAVEILTENAGGTALERQKTIATEETLQAVETAVKKETATRIVISGTDIYVGKAAIASATNAAVWQVKKIDTASDVIITWADGNSNYDNLFTNPAGLSFS